MPWPPKLWYQMWDCHPLTETRLTQVASRSTAAAKKESRVREPIGPVLVADTAKARAAAIRDGTLQPPPPMPGTEDLLEDANEVYDKHKPPPKPKDGSKVSSVKQVAFVVNEEKPKHRIEQYVHDDKMVPCASDPGSESLCCPFEHCHYRGQIFLRPSLLCL